MSKSFDQIMLDECVLVMANDCSLLVAEGEMVAAGVFKFEPEDVTMVIPGVPMRDLMPLKAHEKELRSMLFDMV